MNTIHSYPLNRVNANRARSFPNPPILGTCLSPTFPVGPLGVSVHVHLADLGHGFSGKGQWPLSQTFEVSVKEGKLKTSGLNFQIQALQDGSEHLKFVFS